MAVAELNSLAAYQAELQKPGIVVIDFYSPTCGPPCKVHNHHDFTQHFPKGDATNIDGPGRGPPARHPGQRSTECGGAVFQSPSHSMLTLGTRYWEWMHADFIRSTA